jgi:type I restriction enzyme S subunit
MDSPLRIASYEELGVGWNTSTLGEETLFIRDGTHGTHIRVEQGIPLLSAKDISKTGEVLLNNNPSLISEQDFELIHSKYEIKRGDILLTVVGTLGRCAICKTEERFTIQRSVAVIRVDESEVDTNYLYYFISGIWFQTQLQLRSNSTAQEGVYLGELAQIDIAYPKLPQKKK